LLRCGARESMAGVNWDDLHAFLTQPFPRRDVMLLVGMFFTALATVFTFNGWCIDRFRGKIYRAEDPKGFWQVVIIYYVLGVICLGVFFLSQPQ
jgi:uncharacterized BrkB/YihY/UPF0761 family membrane protein